MLKITNGPERRMDQMPARTLRNDEMWESDLENLIWTHSETFFGELGQKLFLVGKQVRPSAKVEDRIDLLGLDIDGTAVIIELKRNDHKLQLLQAIPYAGMIADWDSDRFLSELSTDEERTRLTDFLGGATD